MGWLTSGRWGLHDKATVVEDCRRIDLRDLARKGAFVPGVSGTMEWIGKDAAVEPAEFRVQINDGVGMALSLHHRLPWNGQLVHQSIALETTTQPFGGHRWWGRCPLGVSGKPCGRRVAVLYLPPDGRAFGCRACHRLTYRSAQEHDKRVDSLVKHPATIGLLLETALREFEAGKYRMLAKVRLAILAEERLATTTERELRTFQNK